MLDFKIQNTTGRPAKNLGRVWILVTLNLRTEIKISENLVNFITQERRNIHTAHLSASRLMGSTSTAVC